MHELNRKPRRMAGFLRSEAKAMLIVKTRFPNPFINIRYNMQKPHLFFDKFFDKQNHEA